MKIFKRQKENETSRSIYGDAIVSTTFALEKNEPHWFANQAKLFVLWEQERKEKLKLSQECWEKFVALTCAFADELNIEVSPYKYDNGQNNHSATYFIFGWSLHGVTLDMFSLCEKCLWKSHHNGKSAPTESNSTHAWNIDGIYPGASYSRSESFTSMSKVDKIFSDSLSEPNLQEIIQEFLYRAEVRRRFVESGYLYD